MKPLFTPEKLANATSQTLLPIECEYCHNIFYVNKHRIKNAQNPKGHSQARFCSKQCQGKANNSHQTVTCLNCQCSFDKAKREIYRHPNHFCSQSCAATYHNTHKTKGTRRSKLEKYLEEELTSLYPHIEFHFNRKDAINAELDIYIPALRLAFELNGIFHYEPIYGTEKLQQIQTNDQRKFQACIEQGIEMCTIDTSTFSYFKKNCAYKYLKIITDIISAKL